MVRAEQRPLVQVQDRTAYVPQRAFSSSDLGLFIGRGPLWNLNVLLDRVSPPARTLNPTDAKTLILQLNDSDGLLAFQAETAKRYGLNTQVKAKKDFLAIVRSLKQMGFNLVAYLQVFKNGEFVRVYPSEACREPSGKIFKDSFGSFIDPSSDIFCRYFFELVHEITAESDLFGEVMLDYIRYPEYSRLIMPISGEISDDRRCEVIADFVRDLHHSLNNEVALSGALFPRCKSIGQDFERLYPIFDTICPMLYPSHFFRKPAEMKTIDWQNFFFYLSDLVTKNLNPTWRAKFKPFLQGFSFEKTATNGVRYKPLSEELMAWQLEAAALYFNSIRIYNSRSQYENFWQARAHPF